MSVGVAQQGEFTEFNMAVAKLHRLDILLWKLHLNRIERAFSDLNDGLLSVYLELKAYMDDTEIGECERLLALCERGAVAMASVPADRRSEKVPQQFIDLESLLRLVIKEKGMDMPAKGKGLRV